MPIEHGLYAIQVVVAELDRQVANRFRDPGRQLGCADEPVVDGEERMVGTHGDQVPAGVRPGQLDRGGGHVGAVLGKLDHLGAFDQAQQRLGTLHLEDRGPIEIGAREHLAVRGFDNGGKRMSERDAPQPGTVFDVLVAVGVLHVASPAPDDERGCQLGILVVALGVGVASAGYQGVCLLMHGL